MSNSLPVNTFAILIKSKIVQKLILNWLSKRNEDKIDVARGSLDHLATQYTQVFLM
jgi:hypothetical protein